MTKSETQVKLLEKQKLILDLEKKDLKKYPSYGRFSDKLDKIPKKVTKITRRQTKNF